MGLCQWGRAVPGLSPHRAENTVLMAELTTSAPQRCSPCPGDSQGLSPRAGPQGPLLEVCGLWALQKFVPTLCKLRLGSSRAVTSPCSVGGCWAPVAHLLLPASPCLVPLQKWGPPWLQPGPPLSCSAQWHHHCAPAAGHSQSCSRPGSIPHSSTQHPCVASSTARLGPGGDIRVQEGWGGPHDLEP